MAPATQVKLLRVLEERAFRRLGGQEEIKVDVRMLAATNRNPESALKEGKLREDLYYRLNVFRLFLPPLRERLDDVPQLVEHFTREFSEANGKPLAATEPRAMQALATYHWPGNVRELRNVIERAVIVASDKRIGLDELPPFVTRGRRTENASSEGSDELGPTRRDDRRAGGAKPHLEDAGGHGSQQDTCGGDPGNQLEDASQQAKEVSRVLIAGKRRHRRPFGGIPR